MNGLFVFLALWPNVLSVPILLFFVQVNSEYLAIKTALYPIMNQLLRSAAIYSPNTYSQTRLLGEVLPARAALPHLDNIGQCLHIVLILYLISTVLLYVIYLPFIWLLVKGLRNFRMEDEKDEEIKCYPDVEADRLRYLNNKFRQQHEAVLQHVVMTYFSTIVYIPVIIWLLIISYQDAYVIKSYWWDVALIGLHGPYAIVTSISLFLLHKSASAL
ncbi:hypothetical protein DFH28DRAFT_1085734 [Melampsora americana]|nr:hypothetical protein DFH28DRAFT_1085734 [Melampsora americana]